MLDNVVRIIDDINYYSLRHCFRNINFKKETSVEFFTHNITTSVKFNSMQHSIIFFLSIIFTIKNAKNVKYLTNR